MPSRTLPTFSASEVESHRTAKSCYVTLGDKVYDVTDFLDAHPGGGDLILEYGGKDVKDILNDHDSHFHSEAAYDVLDDSHIGFLAMTKQANGNAANAMAKSTALENSKANGNGSTVHPRTGMSCEEDLSKETDFDTDYKKHKFLDLNRPLFPQMLFSSFSKDFYLDQVHRPRHYKGGASAPLFGNFLEPLSLTPWWVIPLVWIPPVAYGTYISNQGFSSGFVQAAFWGIGLFIWTLVEYLLHRFLFHLD